MRFNPASAESAPAGGSCHGAPPGPRSGYSSPAPAAALSTPQDGHIVPALARPGARPRAGSRAPTIEVSQPSDDPMPRRQLPASPPNLLTARTCTYGGREVHSEDGDGVSSCEPSPVGRRRSSGGAASDASARPRALLFTQQRTKSIAATKMKELRQMDSSLNQWTTPLSRRVSEIRGDSCGVDLLTAEQVKTYHHLLEGLQHIKGLHDCVDHPCGNIYWDFRTKRCLPGRVWHDHMPDHVKRLVDRPFQEAEVRQIEDAINLHSAPSNPADVEPRALFVIGPAAAGKSAVRTKTEDMLQISLSDYVEIDGDEFREKHAGWMTVLKGDRTAGYKDALKALLKHTRELKKRVLSEAISKRQNILLPSTASNFEKLQQEVQNVREKGYRVDVIGLVVSYREARARALNRAHENGRWNDGTMEKWNAAMEAICYFMEPEHSDWCIVFDNEDFSNPSTIFSRTHSRSFVENVIKSYRDQDEHYVSEVVAERKGGKSGPKGTTTFDT
eukprot:TRINITY_DN4361_c0_g1_i1.p1 TRINITY_DN4361_c0_g1~~TRINITY_DN4361_c0_g1_i1.p1  ORF type:complete len:518 (+),score=179.31 TRINITY_DN4361_c0_g1_i1:51-1556(+)